MKKRETCLFSVSFPSQLPGLSCQPGSYFSVKVVSCSELAVMQSFPWDLPPQSAFSPAPAVNGCKNNHVEQDSCVHLLQYKVKLW